MLLDGKFRKVYIQKDGNHQCSGRSIVSLFGTLIKLSSLIKTLKLRKHLNKFAVVYDDILFK